MLKRKIIPVVLCAFLLAGFSFTQQRTERPPQQPPPPQPTKEMKLEHLTKKLLLNDQQVKKVEEVLRKSGKNTVISTKK